MNGVLVRSVAIGSTNLNWVVSHSLTMVQLAPQPTCALCHLEGRVHVNVLSYLCACLGFSVYNSMQSFYLPQAVFLVEHYFVTPLLPCHI